MSNPTQPIEPIQISHDTLQKILDNSSDEIFVVDGSQRIVYVNYACERHYGLKPAEVIGRNTMELFEEGYWTPSIIPSVFERKKTVTMKQTTYLGGELITTAVPILNQAGDIELVVINSKELQNYKSLEIKDAQTGQPADPDAPEANLITNSEKMESVIKFCKKIASVDSTVLIQGESGTGKSVLAKYIHKMSRRKKGPLLTINCAAIPEELLESELFGYAQGAFTGASKTGKVGLIESADNGTLFLDEVGEISPKIQAKLLQVIQDHEFIPVGGRETKKVDIRIIAATNRNLYDMVQNRQFREDLYYRLNVIDIKIPPLRERTKDIIPLTYYFLHKFNKQYGVNQLISQATLDIFSAYSWPGNLRQLENLIEKLVVTTDSVIEASDLPEHMLQHTKARIPSASLPAALDDALAEVEKQLVTAAYQKLGSTRRVAEHLRISQTKAARLIRKYGGSAGEPPR